MHKEWVSLLLILGLWAPVCAQNSLSSVRQSVQGGIPGHRLPRSPERSQTDDEHEWRFDDDDDDDHSPNSIGEWNPLGGIFLLPFSGPRYFLEDTGQEAYFTEYPFANQYSGNLLIEPLWHPNLKTSRLRFGTEYGDNFDRQQKITTRLQYERKDRLGIDSSFDYLREQLGGGEHDQLWLGDINLTWRFAQAEFAELRAGVGYNWMAATNASGKGLNFTYGGSFYLDNPNVLDFDIDLGRIGDAGLTRFKTSYSRYIKRIRLSVGYEHLRLGVFETDYFTAGLSLDY